MRVRCTRGITPHTFHGNFFVRSTDLLSLPNINPDSGFAMQASFFEIFYDTQLFYNYFLMNYDPFDLFCVCRCQSRTI